MKPRKFFKWLQTSRREKVEGTFSTYSSVATLAKSLIFFEEQKNSSHWSENLDHEKYFVTVACVPLTQKNEMFFETRFFSVSHSFGILTDNPPHSFDELKGHERAFFQLTIQSRSHKHYQLPCSKELHRLSLLST